MSRRSNQTFNCKQLDELARQLVRAPELRRAEQVRRAEKLHDQIAHDATYPYDYLAYRITGYRPPQSTDTVLLIGEAVSPDLRLLIDNLSRSIRMAPEPGEELETVEQLADRLNVSAKTIERWRKSGLRWRWVFDAARGKAVVCLPREAVERFILQKPTRVRRAGEFARLSSEQREQALALAHELVRNKPGITLNQAALVISKQLDRAHETIRLLLAQQGPSLFPGRATKLSQRDHRLIERAMRWGVPVTKLARRFGKSPGSIRRAAACHRLARLRALDLSGPSSPLFTRPDAQEVYLTSERAQQADRPAAVLPRVPLGELPEPIKPLYQQPMLEAANQQHLLGRYHYLRFAARELVTRTPHHAPRVGDLDLAEDFIKQSQALRSRIVRANLPVVLSVARRHTLRDPHTPPHLIVHLLAAGHEELIDAAHAFDPFTSRDFSRYLINRLLRRYAAMPDSIERRRALRRDDDQRVLDNLLAEARLRGVDLLAE